MSKKDIIPPEDMIEDFLDIFDTLVDGFVEVIDKIVEESFSEDVNKDEVSEEVAEFLSSAGVELKTGETIQAQDISQIIQPFMDRIKEQFEKTVWVSTSGEEESNNSFEEKLSTVVPAVTNAAMEFLQKATSTFNINLKDMIAQVYKLIEEDN